jgi:hypothetical protein
MYLGINQFNREIKPIEETETEAQADVQEP